MEQLRQTGRRDDRAGRNFRHLPGAGVVAVIHGAGTAAVDDLADEIQADPVEHDRGDDLVDVEVGFEDAGDRAPERAEQRRGQQADKPGQVQHQRAVQPAERAERVLPGRADIEQAGLEREGDREAGHDERRAVDQRAADAVGEVIEAALDDAHEALVPGVLRVDDEQHDQADKQADEDAQQRGQHRVDALAQLGLRIERAGSFLFCHRLLRLLSLLFGPGHVEAEFLYGRFLGVEFTDDLAFVHDEDAVGEVHDLVQFQADEQHGRAAVALGHDLLVDILDGADVQAAGGLHRNQQLGVFVDLAGDDGFLLVAARHAARDGDAALAAAHVVLFDQTVRVGAHGRLLDEAMVLELRLPVALQHHVFLQRVVQHKAVLVAVFGDMAHAVLRALADGGVGDVRAAQRDAAAAGLFKAGQAVDELGLAVALDARQADDLARAHREADAAHGVFLVHAAGHRQTADLQHRFAGLGRGFFDGKLHVAADHHAGELLLGRAGDFDRANALALAQDGAAVGHRHDLVELVGDEQDALALFFEPAHDLHQLVDLLRGQHGGGFVKNQDLIVAVEHLEDLHALLHTDRDIADEGVRVDPQAVFFRKLHHPLAGGGFLQEACLAGFDAQHDVVEHREALDQFEMLVHHADAQGVGVVGVFDADLLAVLFDRAVFRLVQTEQNAHQRGFTGAVFAQQGVHFAAAQLEGDIVVGLDAGEFLGDVQHLDHEILCQSAHAPFVIQ